jgi:nitroreductase
MEADATRIHELMKERRSIRKYKPDPIPDDMLARIMESATWAPSAMNRQPWKFFVLHDEMRDRLAALHQGLIDEIEDKIREKYGEEGVELRRNLYRNFGNAPVAIVCFTDRREGTPNRNVISAALACENLVLAAQAEGLGSLMMTSSLAMTDEISFLCGVDQKEMMLVLVILLGYPDDQPEAPIRRKKRIVHASHPSDIRSS